ncbi:MAG TPA: DUF4126 domain-containing protein [Bryobacteraceae bacterium]|nr:DUF4126 domain-containing protein [Bryobacteraceae bacterium]
MDALTPLASSLGLGLLAGARLYATVFALGLLLRFHWMALPAAWQHAAVLSDTRVLILSGIACVIEFFADKIPWVDSAWDAVHTFIRPIGAALLASSLFSNVQPVYQVMLFLLAGGVALSGHSAKAATRLAVNHSPEPFSNIALSLGEDVSVAAGLYLLAKHPWTLAGITIGFLGLSAWLAPRICRALRAERAAFGAFLRKWAGDVRRPQLTSGEERWLVDHSFDRVPRKLFAVIATADIKGLRNALGKVCLTGRQAVFFSRKWRGLVERSIGPVVAIEAKKGFLVDHFVLIDAEGRRIRFALLAGQMDGARDEMVHYANSSGDR